jgi:hypothetical protein
MRNKLSCWLLCLLLLGGVACQSGEKGAHSAPPELDSVAIAPVENSGSSDTLASAAVPVGAPPYYRRMRGQMGMDLPITFHLQVDADSFVSGRYAYERVGRPIPLSPAEGSGKGRFSLVEYDPDNPNDKQVSGTFKGDFLSKGVISGDWSQGKGNYKMEFRLEDAYPDGSARILLQPIPGSQDDCPEEACLLVGGSQLRLQGIPGMAAQAIEADLLQAYLGFFSDGESRRSLEAAIDSLRAFHTREIASQGEKEQDLFPMTWSYTVTPQVIFNESGMLSLRLDMYSYTGGAHGNPFSLLRNYSLRSGKRWQLSDLFKSGFEPVLKAQALKYLKLSYGGSLRQDLSELGFLVNDQEFQLNEDFYLCPAGIGFVYSPYEIGPYAMGFAEFFIPFSKIKDWVRLDGPLNGIAKEL